MGDVPEEAAALLEGETVVAHLATCRDGRPHVAPVWYRYLDGTVEIVTTGQKLANVRRNPRVALSVEYSHGGDARWMVAIRGTATVVEDDDAFQTAHRAINEKYGAEPDAWSENTLVRIDVDSVTYSTDD
ncbi:MAG: pyridoxamine 5'-phosphate oxidase family protein [Halobacteriaceae archaeon]